ncbi:MAG: hypothetical protein ACKO3K_09410 [Cuspidothrix sp.]
MNNIPSSDLTNDRDTKSSRPNHHPQFNKWLLVTVAISILIVVSVNFLVDPYGIYKTPNFFGINHEKPQKNLNDRLFKTIDIIRIQPLTIFLGSSRTKQGLDPDHPALSNSQPAYNLAVDGANPYEMMRYLEHTIKNQPNLKEVILGIDFFMFNQLLGNQPGFDESRLEKTYVTPADIMNSLFSVDTLDVSKKTILASLNKSDKDISYGENGFFPILDIKMEVVNGDSVTPLMCTLSSITHTNCLINILIISEKLSIFAKKTILNS